METNKNRITFVDNTNLKPSSCEECNVNCLCDGNISGDTTDIESKCNLGCIDKNRHLLVKGKDGVEDSCSTTCTDECEICAFGKVADGPE